MRAVPLGKTSVPKITDDEVTEQRGGRETGAQVEPTHARDEPEVQVVARDVVEPALEVLAQAFARCDRDLRAIAGKDPQRKLLEELPHVELRERTDDQVA